MIHANRAVAALNIDTHRSEDGQQQCQLDADDGQMPFAASSRLGGLDIPTVIETESYLGIDGTLWRDHYLVLFHAYACHNYLLGNPYDFTLCDLHSVLCVS